MIPRAAIGPMRILRARCRLHDHFAHSPDSMSSAATAHTISDCPGSFSHQERDQKNRGAHQNDQGPGREFRDPRQHDAEHR